MPTIEFDLPLGYKDKTGTVHIHVVMRSPLTEDILKVAQDMEVRQVAQTHKDTTIPGAMPGLDPVKMFLARAGQITLESILFSQVVERVGDITQPGRDIFRKMETRDFNLVEAKYAELIAEPEETGGQTVPFGLDQSAN